MIPIYIFYSMFGFQRTGDGIWAAADQMARGFVLGATAGRTTLTGEGLQHADGHSLLLAVDQPGGGRLRPGLRLRDRAHRRKRAAPDVRREPRRTSSTTSPSTTSRTCSRAEPEDLDVEGLLRGHLPLPAGRRERGPRRRSSSPPGVGVPGALRAASMLAADWNVAADVWSVTSWSELRRDGVAVEKETLRHPGADPPGPRT